MREKNRLIVLEEVCKIPKWKNGKGEYINHDDDEDEYCNDKQLFFIFTAAMIMYWLKWLVAKTCDLHAGKK